MCRIDEFWNIHETFPHFFSKQAKLRQPHRAETADFRFQISNFEIRQIAFLMTCRPHLPLRKGLESIFYSRAVNSIHTGIFAQQCLQLVIILTLNS